MSSSKSVLWWGRFDPDYSRNRVLRQAFRQLGWEIVDFRPSNSLIGDLEAYCRNIKRPDLVWVPSFRQRDVAAASRWAKRSGSPLVFDPLISAYDKQVFERCLLKEGSRRAQRLLRRERNIFSRTDMLVADTVAHSDYFHSEFGVPEGSLQVIPVGAEELLFQPLVHEEQNDVKVEVLFYGTFIDLQGPQIIVEAADRCVDKNIVWTMIGAGPLLDACRNLAEKKKLKNLQFEPWVSYEVLPHRIAKADLLLGVFGLSDKASRVIPNKVYQSLACGRTVVTRESSAYPLNIDRDATSGLVQIAPGDPDELADTVMYLLSSKDNLLKSHAQARSIYEKYFSFQFVVDSLQQLIDKALTHRR